MEKKYINLSLLVVLWAILGSANQMLAQSFAGGSGTEADPYQIETGAQLDAMRDVSFLDDRFILNNDIDLSFATGHINGQFYNGGKGWEPIGHDVLAFAGSLDGNGFVIIGLTINRPSQDTVGLFKNIDSGGKVSNLGLEDIDITGSTLVGGLVGEIRSGAITNSYVTGSVKGVDFTGGLVGWSLGSITNCHSTSSVAGTGSGVIGGLVGYNGTTATINGSYATGSVTGGRGVGGLVAENAGLIINSYATGDVNGIERVGGLAGGASGTITNSYASNSVTGDSQVGGLIGLGGSSTINNSYWNTYTGGPDNGNGLGLTSTQMRQQASFTGWDFNETWDILENDSFPFLRDNTQDPLPGYNPFAGGEGTENDPFQVETAEQLHEVRLLKDAHFILVADIDLSFKTGNAGGIFWNGGEGWEPIGNLSDPFTGSFDGNGFIVEGLTANRPSRNYVGLFGALDNGAEIANLGVEEVTITGSSYVGGLLGWNEGSITSSYVTGNVSGSTHVGGLVGFNVEGTIADSYAAGSATSSSLAVGGLLGYNSGGTVTNSYASSSVTGSSQVGGLVGFSSGTVSGSYWNTDNFGSDNGFGEGLTSAEMRQQTSFTGWDFDSAWKIFEESSFPFLQENPQFPPLGFINPFPGGSGTEADPFQIETVEQLDNIRSYLNAHYILNNDLDLSFATGNSGGQFWNGGEGWEPIGNNVKPFTGLFNGNGFVITGLTVNRLLSQSQIGLFGRIDSGGEVSNLGLEDVSITGASFVGGLVGHNNGGTIANSYTTGSITGNLDYAGGLVGYHSSGTITGSYSMGSVFGSGNYVGGLTGWNGGAIENSYATGSISGNGTAYVGGLAGANSSGTITNSYSTGNVDGDGSLVGGLVGGNINSGIISNSYATGTVLGSSNVGGLAGQNNGSTIVNSYWNTDTGGPDNGIGLGLTSNQMRQQTSFTGWDFGDTWQILEGISYPFLQDNPQNPQPGFINPFAGGSGTEGDPFQIETAEQLHNIRNFLNVHFILTSDIDLSFATGNSGGQFWNEGEGWEPLGDDSESFTGSFGGNGFTIKGLTVNRPSQNYIGLFGYIGDGAEVNNLGFKEANITGNTLLGSLAGFNSGTIAGSYATGRVMGSSYVGGLVGYNSTNGTITEVYTTAGVAGSSYIGGLVGYNSVGGSIAGGYATGDVTGTSNVGGIVGNSGGAVNSSYWNTDTGGPDNGIGQGLTTAQMLHQSSFGGFAWGGENPWEIYEGFSFPFLPAAGNHRTGVSEITGSEGWRIMSAGLEGLSYADLLGPLWTQGFPRSDSPDHGSPNVLVWNETTRSWTAPSVATDVPTAGTGFIVYVYDDQDYDGTPEGFPKSMLLQGEEPRDAVSVPLSYTTTKIPGDTGWNLVGNPYASLIDWDAAEGWTRTNLDGSLYMWNAAAGEYQSWNGVTGTLPTQGLITPWQGFWVKADAPSPVLSLDDPVRTDGDEVPLKKLTVPQVWFTLSGAGRTSGAILMFDGRAESGKDSLDAWKLRPLNGEYLSLYTTATGGEALDINALPLEMDQPFELTMDFEGSDLGGEYTLSWDPNALPAPVRLTDLYTDQVISLNEGGEYTLEVDRDQPSKGLEPLEGSAPSLELPPHGPIPTVLKAKSNNPRFLLTINPNGTENGLAGIPKSLELNQNYPNPFNPETVIRYGVPEQSAVQLSVYDILGRKVATLLNEEKTPGRYQVNFNASRFASGLYIYRLKVGSNVLTRKMMLIK